MTLAAALMVGMSFAITLVKAMKKTLTTMMILMMMLMTMTSRRRAIARTYCPECLAFSLFCVGHSNVS